MVFPGCVLAVVRDPGPSGELLWRCLSPRLTPVTLDYREQVRMGRGVIAAETAMGKGAVCTVGLVLEGAFKHKHCPEIIF